MDKSLRILHISTRLILGGSQENTVLSCEGQATNSHDVHLAYGPIFGPEGSMLDRVEAFNQDHPNATITTHEVPNMVRQIAPNKDRDALRNLKALIQRIKPDIVHTHSSKAGILGRFAAWTAMDRANRPGIVHTVHGPPWMPVEGRRDQQLSIALKNHLYALAERYAAKRCHRIICVADAMTEQYRARGIGTPEQFVTVRSGMDTERYLSPLPEADRSSVRARLGLRADEFVVGTVARLAQHKGHDDLITALAPLMRRNHALRMLWVGDGWWRGRLIARLKAEGIEDQVTFTGLVPQDEIPGLMRAMDVLAHPSAREGLPRTVPQALLAGTAVVATDTDGTREVCLDPSTHADTSTGLLIPVGEPEALRFAVQTMIDEPEQRAAMTQRGREMCAQMFSVERMIENLERVYAEAMRSARG